MHVLITVDMDNYREYRTLADPDGTQPDVSFYDAVPEFLDILAALGAKATFFAIGCDAASPRSRKMLRRIAGAGHEIGNHSYSHPYNFRDLPRERKQEEIRLGEDAIADVLGARPRGFRTPSGDVDLETLEILRERGYLYDSSVIPSPLLMWTFMLYGRLFVRHGAYNLGHFWSVMAPPWPYLPSRRKLHRAVEAGTEKTAPLVEIPFSALPVLRVPFYATLFRIFPLGIFDAAVRLHGRRRPALHMLFHLIDLFDVDGTPLADALGRMPGLAVPIARRRSFVRYAFERMAREGEAITLDEAARRFLRERGLGQ